MFTRPTLRNLWRIEFHNYTRADFQRDLLAGLTVGAVALPLALAFGVASGATPAAGLVTAILAGLIIGALSGASMQISGPTDAMSAVLIVLAERYGLEGVWVVGVLSGVALLAIGLLRLGRFIAFMPASVITGFTSGIALIIAIAQIDNFLGVTIAKTETAAEKLLGYFGSQFMPNWYAVTLGLIVIATMLVWPKAWALCFPASLLGLSIATLINALLAWPVNVIGTIPQTLYFCDPNGHKLEIHASDLAAPLRAARKEPWEELQFFDADGNIVRHRRADWEARFREKHWRGDDALLDDGMASASAWDTEGWKR